MEYRILGRTGVRVSPICLGTDNFADPTPADEATRILNRALDEGPLRQASYLVIRSVDQIQLSFDIAWDVLISTGVVAFGVGMVRRGGLIRLLGALGILGAGTGLVLNLITFPTPPAAKGFIDPGALFFTWYGLTFGAVFILFVQECQKKRRDDTQATSPKR